MAPKQQLKDEASQQKDRASAEKKGGFKTSRMDVFDVSKPHALRGLCEAFRYRSQDSVRGEVRDRWIQ
jgi:hypothetical protein